ncbi:MAG: ABC transporter, substrate-binding protein (cluster 1, maltose/g3p/polyamine/iron) [Candidatus Bipolaricaulis sibiricus]|uniref:ABC transporter, substrate-binding protein (Cluster 1, maltose/g3p/polyamine/iron) n=1 Tax=Bipolaricaulis sibiricus TaxID=2501609 RepID=A0A410FV11_BIPS1|nr:MAG: ABC transporter, substrate-binding protein (cluster 1, maltose/g3p/polyamine/iron) [Candidatus Bipolaricaulis sibiricus]
MKMRTWFGLLALAFGLVAVTAGAQIVTITYWQYEFASKVQMIDELIAEFEAQNPGIKVRHETFPYAVFAEKVATSVPAGVGPHIVNLYYGWLPAWQRAGYLQPLPEDTFPTDSIESEFAPLVRAAKIDGRYWGLPTAVRTLALFYNVDLFEENGISGPPETWDELISIAQKLTTYRGGRFVRAGFGMAPDGQDHHLVREILLRQFGGAPYSDDSRTVTYNTPEGEAALKFYTDFRLVHQIGEPDFPFPGVAGYYRDGFIAGLIGMIVDGSFAIGAITRNAPHRWAVAELPRLTPDGERHNFASFWMHGLTPLAQGAELEAAVRFLQFITSEQAMKRWVAWVGELPARLSLVDNPELVADPILGPFVAALPYSHATFFVDEAAQRAVMIDAVLRVIRDGMDPAESLRRAATEEQAILDRFWQAR